MNNAIIHPCCLTIAGSDSGGNAGVQADLRAFHHYGLHGCTVFSALTAQNPMGVTAIHTLDAGFVAAELDAVLGFYDIRALKTGMLSDPEIIELLAARLAEFPNTAKVIDPVMVATSGAKLIDEVSVAAMAQLLLPQATIITPNLPEAEFLTDGEVSVPDERNAGLDHVRDLAKALFDRFGASVLVKGGHGDTASAVDVFYDGRKFQEFALPWVERPISTHGTGCSLSAALAAELAQGAQLPEAIAGAKRYVHEAISNSYWVGPNCGVLGFA